MLALAATIGLAGCEGDDGKDGLAGTPGTPGTPGATGPIGPSGPTGPTGPTGPGASVQPRESCGVCHADASSYSAKVAHALDPVPVASTPVFAVNGADLDITYNVKIGTSNATGFTVVRTDYRLAAGGAQSDLGTPDPVVTDLGSGNYRIKVLGGAANAAANSRYFFRIANAAGTNVGVWGDYPAAPRTDLVSNQSCNNCHSDVGILIHDFKPYDYPAMVNSQCVVCHTGSLYTWIPDKWVGIVHGIHNSHNMPTGSYEFNPTTKFSVTYPTYTTNCSVCHDSPTTLAAANAMPVTGAGCFSCHQSMDSWDFTASGTTFHEAYDETTNCQTCHNTSATAAAPNLYKVTQFHNSLETERVGIIWDGVDLSVTEGKKFTWTLTSVVDDGTNLKISWSATYNGAAVDPCNSVIGAGKPIFHNAPAGTVLDGAPAFLRSYAQGDDFVIGKANAPGQPGTLTLNTTNTTCAGNVATTTWAVDKDVAAGTRGYVALQGKPQLPLPAGFDRTVSNYTFTNMYVRVPTPDREFVVGTGAKPATERRAISDTADCLKCHVGSLYQHGNTRVDNVKMCGACHNSASSDQNNRLNMGVTASEAYDRLVGQTYEFKTMLHAIHSAGGQTGTFAIYRNRGIYAWVPEGVTPPNWPKGAPTCRSSTDAAAPAPISGYLVFGADPAVTQSCQTHNLYHPTYPRAINDCAACHVAGFGVIPDQSKAVATTLDAGKPDSGTGTSTVWRNQLDDTLQGASAAACTSCHQSTDAKGHAYQNGWTPQTFPNGRQTILDTK
jgi:OmcA/MtrC family decaheme c-type cytochrome